MSTADQSDFETCYRGRQGWLHHLAYMRRSKVTLAQRVLGSAAINLDGKSVFDYGFGAGTFFRHCPPTCRCSGVEIDSENVKSVRAMLASRGITADLQTIQIESWDRHPLLDQTYDLFLCSHVLEHLPNPVGFLRRIRSCIAPDGHFVGLVPINEREMDPHHIQQVDRQMILNWAKAANFTVTTYTEADYWKYWPQPFLAGKDKPNRVAAKAVSLALGIPSAMLPPRLWFALSRIFGLITFSKPTQAAFVLKPL